jgi:hypothetical protein
MADTTGEAALVFHDLGALVLDRDEGRLPIAGRRLEGAVCTLLVHVNRQVSSDAMAQALGPGDVGKGRSGSQAIVATIQPLTTRIPL